MAVLVFWSPERGHYLQDDKKRNMCNQCFWNLNTPSQSLHICCNFLANMVFSDSHVSGKTHIVLDGCDPSVCGVTNEDCYFVVT